MSGAGLVTYALEERVARIGLNDPETLNSATEAMGEQLLAALDRAAGEASAVLLTGEGRAFCSGANLADAAALVADPLRDGGAQLERVFNPVIVAMRAMDQPIVTAARGVIAGVGCGIALAGDIIVCAENAYIFPAFRHVGLVPDGGATWLLSKAVGRVRAMQLMLLGEKLPASLALEWGLVTQVVADGLLDATAREIARGLASGPQSLGMIKRLAWDGLESTLNAALGAERASQCLASRSDDFVEGVSAFLERRRPAFKGRRGG